MRWVWITWRKMNKNNRNRLVAIIFLKDSFSSKRYKEKVAEILRLWYNTREYETESRRFYAKDQNCMYHRSCQ